MGYLQLTQTVRVANARIRAARDLDARWKALGPDGQDEARTEWENLKAALAAVRARIEAGPRGFVREFNAALKGEEPEPVAAPRSLGDLVRELHLATDALRDKLDAEVAAAPRAAAPPRPDTEAPRSDTEAAAAPRSDAVPPRPNAAAPSEAPPAPRSDAEAPPAPRSVAEAAAPPDAKP